jgi:peptide/nickel transport system permease protein
MHVIWHIARRASQVVMTVFFVAVLTFALMRFLPGDPAIVLLGDRATDASITRLHHEMGLDQPIIGQFWHYLSNLVTLRLGNSITLRIPVTTLLLQKLPVTLALTGYALILAVSIAFPLAFIAAINEGGLADLAIRLVSQIGISMPVFYVALILLIGLAAGLGWFPVGGLGTGILSNLRALFLPAFTLAFSLSAILMRNLRAAIIGVLHAEFIGFARAKGLPRRMLLFRHVLRNALVSTLTLLGINIGGLVGGAVVTETVFAVPGIGRLLVDSIFARDYAVVQGTTLVIAVMVSIVFLLTDALQAALDPRIDA